MPDPDPPRIRTVATIDTSLLVDGEGRPRFLQASDVIAAAPAYMVCAQLAFTGLALNGLFGALIASTDKHVTERAPSLVAIVLVFVAFAIAYYRTLGRFARTPSAASRRDSAIVFAALVALFAIIAFVQVAFVAPHEMPSAVAVVGYDRVALAFALIPAALAAFAFVGIRRTDVEKLARDGFIAGE